MDKKRSEDRKMHTSLKIKKITPFKNEILDKRATVEG